MACLVLPVAPAIAQVSLTDLQVVGRALSFLNPPLSGKITLGIVYLSGDARSSQEAQAVNLLLGNGLSIGGITLQSRMVNLAQTDTADVNLFFLMPGMGEQAESLAVVNRRRHLICVTTDVAQVEAGRCALGVRSRPKVQIMINRATAVASGTAFSTVFRMMITEL